ncbi:5-oxoprolinase subunit PxpB [Mesobacillus subterraneus]|uniref:5-oxoprolinase subunit PxpB n=1 Tax=Mesobacillus subterraneus TaxID=285983 RepID=UPI00203CF36E|nr:5-oxoprolinase subunit PxpB [Mesobacillus subterraneus]MCM3666740.1 5-oxoprolinase subunit PxpB [Mesobacillus subterraneus]MCM3685637.1 5-oxoprolinase subunit PxpB [Mesobacillus subterraneus]
MNLVIVPLGDSAVRISLGDKIDEGTNGCIRKLINKLEKAKISGVIEWVPAYTSLAIYYEPDRISYAALCKELEKIHHSSVQFHQDKPVVFEIPVCYGGEMGPDLAYVAEYHGLSEQEIIKLHANREYLIYMMGFMPGFPYLGGLPEKVAVPRLENPRKSVLPGSVGIGGNQTGIYPADVPSGWRIIGVTPVSLFEPIKEEPFLLSAGNYIKFVPIDKEQFLKIKKLGESYQVKTYARE